MANSILAVSTASAPHVYSRQKLEQAALTWLKGSPHHQQIFSRFLNSSRIAQRHFCVPIEQILSLGGMEMRSAIFHEHGTSLLQEVVSKILLQSETNPETVDSVIFTSCSMPTIPSIESTLPELCGLRATINRVPLYQHGCAGGIVGLSLANRLNQPHQLTLLVSVELCSLVYQSADLSAGNLVGSALFGDGAAAVLIDQAATGLHFIDARSYLIPNSNHLMGYAITDNGNHLRLDKDLPVELTRHAPPFVEKFLADNKCDSSQIDWWLFHPGGAKVLHALEEAFKISPERSRWAWDVLAAHGNMSSASILFVLEKFIGSGVAQPGDKICMVGVGPGLTLESILLEYQQND